MTEEQMYYRLYVIARQMKALAEYMPRRRQHADRIVAQLALAEAEGLMNEARNELTKRGFPLEESE